MKIVWEILLLVFPIFAAYSLRFQSITAKLSDWLSAEEAGLNPALLRKIIAPPAQTIGGWVSLLLAMLALGLGIREVPWYAAIGAFLGSLLLILLMNYFIPSEQSRHYYAVIQRHLARKIARSGDEERLALQDLRDRLERIKTAKSLFTDQSSYIGG